LAAKNLVFAFYLVDEKQTECPCYFCKQPCLFVYKKSLFINRQTTFFDVLKRQKSTFMYEFVAFGSLVRIRSILTVNDIFMNVVLRHLIRLGHDVL